MKNEQENNQCKYYEERRAELVTIRSDSIDSFDKALLQVSTGALVITITFIDKIGKPYDNFTNGLLITFWSLFLVVILVNIFSYWTAKKNMDFKITNLDDRYNKNPDNWQNIPEGFSKWKTCTEICNHLALWSFIIGAILFFWYAYMVQIHNYQTTNKKEEIIMADDKKIPLNEGQTETTEKIRNDYLKKGKTEVPEKEIRPPKPEPAKEKK